MCKSPGLLPVVDSTHVPSVHGQAECLMHVRPTFDVSMLPPASGLKLSLYGSRIPILLASKGNYLCIWEPDTKGSEGS